MNPLGRLGELYGLSPSTLTGLAGITGGQAPPPVQAAPPLDPDSPEAWAAAARAQGVEDGVRAPSGATYASPSNSSAESAPGKADPNLILGAGIGSGPPAPTPAESKAAAASHGVSLQGPADDSFPTVRTDFGDPNAASGAAGVSPRVVVPAHWQPGTHSVSVQHGLNPEALQEGKIERELGAREGLAAADAHLDSVQKAALADAVYAGAHSLVSKQTNERIAQIERQRAAYVREEQTKFERLAVEAEKKIDPDQYWKEKGKGAQIAAAIAIGLNQFAVMWSGRGTNTAMQLIDEAIARNIDSQKANIANARNAISSRESVFAKNLMAFGDRERAALATKVQYLDQVAGMAEQMRASAKSTEAEAGYHAMRQQIYDRRAAAADQFGQLTADRSAEQMNEIFKPTTVLGGATPGAKGKEDHYVPSLGGYARSKEDAAKLNAKGALRMQIGENMHQIHQKMEEAKHLSSANPKEHMRLQQIDEQIQGLINDSLTKNTVLEGQGAMSEGDKATAAAAKNLKGISVQWKPDVTINKYQTGLKEAAVNMLTAHRIEGEAFGIQKGTELYAPGPTGPVPVAKLEGRNATVSKRTQGHDDLVQKPKGVPQKREEKR